MVQFSSKFKSPEKLVKSDRNSCPILSGENTEIIRQSGVIQIPLKVKTFNGFGPRPIRLKTNVRKIKSI